ncbi:MAG: SIR2 family protein, partial [Zoogloea sp.]|nr:SIR2 family protein [Zoogloea sp.]
MGNATLIDKLKDDIAAGRVVVIAGTGVSVAASGNPKIAGHHVATWTGLLGHGIAHCTDRGTITPEVANHLTAQLRLGETDLLITAAETVSQRLRGQSPGTFRGWLKDSIGQLKVQAPALIDALQALGGLIATLNYDTLIEQATGRRPVTWRQADVVTDVLRNTRPDAVLHLHGVYEEPDSVVLGLASYLQVRDDPHASTVLRSLAQGRTLLFVGCGDTVNDPNFARLIEWAKAALDDVAPHHVFLCRQSERSAFQDRLRDAPWLQPLAYGDD